MHQVQLNVEQSSLVRECYRKLASDIIDNKISFGIWDLITACHNAFPGQTGNFSFFGRIIYLKNDLQFMYVHELQILRCL